MSGQFRTRAMFYNTTNYVGRLQRGKCTFRFLSKTEEHFSPLLSLIVGLKTYLVFSSSQVKLSLLNQEISSIQDKTSCQNDFGCISQKGVGMMLIIQMC